MSKKPGITSQDFGDAIETTPDGKQDIRYCKSRTPQIARFLTKRFKSGDDRREFEQHLVECKGCRDFVTLSNDLVRQVVREVAQARGIRLTNRA